MTRTKLTGSRVLGAQVAVAWFDRNDRLGQGERPGVRAPCRGWPLDPLRHELRQRMEVFEPTHTAGGNDQAIGGSTPDRSRSRFGPFRVPSLATSVTT